METHSFINSKLVKGFRDSTSAGDARDLGSHPGSKDFLEKGMATHSSILAWKIPWAEEPGGL